MSDGLSHRASAVWQLHWEPEWQLSSEADSSAAGPVEYRDEPQASSASTNRYLQVKMGILKPSCYFSWLYTLLRAIVKKVVCGY